MRYASLGIGLLIRRFEYPDVASSSAEIGGCAGWVYEAVGTSNAYRIYVNVDSDSSHVTVLMLNGRIVPGDIADAGADTSLDLHREKRPADLPCDVCGTRPLVINTHHQQQ